MRMEGRRLGPYDLQPSACPCWELLAGEYSYCGLPPDHHKFENGSTVFVWDDGRRLERVTGITDIYIYTVSMVHQGQVKLK